MIGSLVKLAKLLWTMASLELPTRGHRETTKAEELDTFFTAQSPGAYLSFIRILRDLDPSFKYSLPCQ